MNLVQVIHQRWAAAAALKQADVGWLARLITRRVALARFADAFAPRADDVKVVLEMTGQQG